MEFTTMHIIYALSVFTGIVFGFGFIALLGFENSISKAVVTIFCVCTLVLFTFSVFGSYGDDVSIIHNTSQYKDGYANGYNYPDNVKYQWLVMCVYFGYHYTSYYSRGYVDGYDQKQLDVDDAISAYRYNHERDVLNVTIQTKDASVEV